MLRKKLSCLALCALLFMQPQARAFAWSNAFNNTMTGVHWFILATSFLGWLRPQMAVRKEINQFPDASLEVSDYIKAVLRKHNCSEALVDNIQIKLGAHFMAQYSFYGNHIITVPKDFEECFKNKPTTEAVIRHEAAHLEHKDFLRMGAIILISIALAHHFVNGVTYPISYVLQPYTPSVVQGLMKLPLAIIKSVLIAGCYTAFAKYKEYSADKKAAESIQDPAVLKAMAEMSLQIYEQYERDQKFDLSDPKERRGTWHRFILDEVRNPDPLHHNYLLRSQIFANAAKELEKTPQAEVV